MTVELLGPIKTSENANAELLKTALITSAPELEQPGIRLTIVQQVFAQNREIDCVLVFEDLRRPEELFCTSRGVPVKSFVACVEVKQHSPDAIRFHGTHLEVQYGDKWHDATAQAEAQIWALKNFQENAYLGKVTCDTINDIARALEVPEWDVEPDKSVTGGRITVLVESQPRSAIECTQEILREDLANQPQMRPVDALVCLPHTASTPGANYCNLFEMVQEQNRSDYWRGYDWETRQNREYPNRQTALRAVLYQSCRGMEGWTTLCMGLDKFYDHVLEKPAAERRAYALNWLMIPLTRSMDHLVIHLTDADSALGRILQGIDRDKISWRLPRCDDARSA